MPEILTKPHNTATCTEDNGQPCDQCLWAEEAERTRRFLGDERDAIDAALADEPPAERARRHEANQRDYEADLERRRATTTRDFPAVLNEWTDVLLELNRQAQTTGEIQLIARVGLLGQRLIFEAHTCGMEAVTAMMRERVEGR